jgi:hypothetical protein
VIKLKCPVFSPGQAVSVWLDWGLELAQCTSDLALVLEQPYRIAALPVLCNEPTEFSFDPVAQHIDYSQFDLVILTDIEFRPIKIIKDWITRNNIKKYVLAVGGIGINDQLDEYTVYRPHWMYNLLRLNQYSDSSASSKPFLFEALLGARRPHRDYVMLSLQQSGLLSKSIVTYRNIFNANIVDNFSQEFALEFPDIQLAYPYVSEHLNNNWEVQPNLDLTISSKIPIEIYKNTWYSIVCETLGVGHDMFFLSEKTAKALFSKRMFISFSAGYFLKNLRLLGFETFSSVIDESYDSVLIDHERFSQAFQQVKYLSTQDPILIHQKIAPILEHNHHQTLILRQATQQCMAELLRDSIPSQYITDQI